MPVLSNEQSGKFEIPPKNPGSIRMAVSHEFVELYRGDKDIHVGKLLCENYDYEIVHLGTDIASPGDSKVFGSTAFPIDHLPPLPDSYFLLLQKSRLIWHRRGNMGMGGFFRLTPSIIPQLLRWKPDIILENPYLTLSPRSFMTYIAGRRLGIPTVYIDAGDIVRNNGLKNKIVYPFERPVVRRAAAIITYNEMGKQRLMNKYLYPSDKIHVIPKPIDTSRFAPDTDARKFIAEFDLQGKFVVAYFGRLCTNKGTRSLLEAADNMHKRGTDNDIVFIFVGGNLENGHAVEFNKYLKSLDLDNVKVTGMFPNSRMPEAYAAADIAVFPDVSNPPGFSTVLAESMASGCPIIIGNKGEEEATPIIDGEIGLVVSPRNAGEIADRIELLKNDDNLRNKLSANVLEFARSRMNYDKIVAKYHELFVSIIGKTQIVGAIKPEYAGSDKTNVIA